MNPAVRLKAYLLSEGLFTVVTRERVLSRVRPAMSFQIRPHIESLSTLSTVKSRFLVVLPSDVTIQLACPCEFLGAEVTSKRLVHVHAFDVLDESVSLCESFRAFVAPIRHRFAMLAAHVLLEVRVRRKLSAAFRFWTFQSGSGHVQQVELCRCPVVVARRLGRFLVFIFLAYLATFLLLLPLLFAALLRLV